MSKETTGSTGRGRRPRHPDKDVEKEIQALEAKGWLYQKPGKSSHTWGRMIPPGKSGQGDVISVYTSARGNTVRTIRKKAKKYETATPDPHEGEDSSDE